MAPGDNHSTATEPDDLKFRAPTPADGPQLHRLAIESKTLDVNTRYSYVLWCRDFAASSVVAADEQGVAGFVTGYLRPDSPRTLFVWQVATADRRRRQGLARRMLDHLFGRVFPEGDAWLEATVTPDNTPSARLFTSFAQAHDAETTRDELFSAELLGEDHEPEILYRIGPAAAS